MTSRVYGCNIRAMSSESKLRMLRADITASEHHELRVLAARKGLTAARLVANALRTSPATREAFKGEETSK